MAMAKGATVAESQLHRIIRDLHGMCVRLFVRESVWIEPKQALCELHGVKEKKKVEAVAQQFCC